MHGAGKWDELGVMAWQIAFRKEICYLATLYMQQNGEL